MRGGAALVLALGVAGCGRLAFDPQPECTLANVIESPYANSAEGADGTSEDTAFLICTEAQLAQIAQHPEHQAGYFRVGADIELTQPFTPIGDMDIYFVGAFNGGGHTIRNLSIDRPTEDDVGMFRYLGDGARVHDLTFADAVVHGGGDVGVLAGSGWGLTIDRVTVTGMVTADNAGGGVIGYASTYGNNPTDLPVNITNLDVTITLVASNGNSGGAIGIVAPGSKAPLGHIAGIRVSGAVTGGIATGGAIGLLEFATLDDAHADVTVTGDTDAGGLVGSSFGTAEITHSSSAGDVTCTGAVCGGLIADEASLISHCVVTGNITCKDIYCGGLSADPFGPVEYSYVTGTVTGTDYVGGLLAAPNSDDIHDCYATGDVNGRDYVGGLVGWQAGAGSITRSYSTSRVKGRDVVGGLVGQAGYGTATSTVTDSFATGDVSGASAAGRVSFMVALSVGTVTANGLYNSAQATCTNTAGGCAITSSSVNATASFYSSAQVPLTTWDFTNIWREMPGAFPELR